MLAEMDNHENSDMQLKFQDLPNRMYLLLHWKWAGKG